MNREILLNMGKAIDLIKESSNIFIASHINPDGDNIGSSLALALALKKINKNIVVLKSDIIPIDFTFLPGINLIKEYDDKLDDIDLFITLDCGDINRLGQNKILFENAKKTINIDHHISNTNFGDINIVDSKVTATGELIYYFIKQMEIEIDKDIATNIYTAISTDTGSFKYESVSSDTHRIIADLLDIGIDKSDININLYENMSFTRMKLFIKSLTTLETFNNGKIAVIEVTQEMLKETGASLEDSEGIVSFIKKLSTVEAACILKELEKEDIKISLRTKKYLDASYICNKFDGGGHKRAAGCTIYKGIKEAKELIVKSIQEAMKV
ncbi:DHH family phosphoesterase [Tissierella creatinophila]|uniref:Bifunctional oligoribonuclease and PAP phosphatase NrnA n=1 Tax=Tissierella creatinophila DSM 6911 TaxID=1123403 RepID=A0A1U7M369_TISCR|nr:bifunctional oligoribonuclease/PAP phosphatase NrnA [Tissierella creatinophila]OLS01764.1 bifunctional oligoribonuclease and PAP phosphatase NrnA [Tissierella creatinophila DSM 6911]